MPIEIHPRFKLNGTSYSLEEVKEVAYSLVKEGEGYEQEIGSFLLDWVNDAPTLDVNTSGSTGPQKRISLEKSHMANSARATGEFFNLKAGNTALNCLPINYIAGKMMLVRAMVLGLEIDYIEPSSNPLEYISNTYDFCAMVPLQLENSLDLLDLIKTIIVGGAPVSKKVIALLQDKITAVYETYGMTETVSHIAVRKINHPTKIPSNMVTEMGLGTVDETIPISRSNFNCLPNILLSADERGCLVIHAPDISRNEIVTNDLVFLISETEFEWLGRFDNTINSGGIKLFPEQIEAKLALLIPNRFFVIGLPDEQLGQKMVLLVEGDLDKKELMKNIQVLSSLTGAERPKEIYCIPKMRATPNGKLLRRETLLQALNSKT